MVWPNILGTAARLAIMLSHLTHVYFKWTSHIAKWKLGRLPYSAAVTVMLNKMYFYKFCAYYIACTYLHTILYKESNDKRACHLNEYRIMWTTNICASAADTPQHPIALPFVCRILYCLCADSRSVEQSCRHARQTFEYCFTIRPTLIRNTRPMVAKEANQRLYMLLLMACCPKQGISSQSLLHWFVYYINIATIRARDTRLTVF